MARAARAGGGGGVPADATDPWRQRHERTSHPVELQRRDLLIITLAGTERAGAVLSARAVSLLRARGAWGPGRADSKPDGKPRLDPPPCLAGQKRKPRLRGKSDLRLSAEPGSH